jgi:uncharacterized protein
MAGERDRDATGRARNARPRDELGRPLARGTEGAEPLPEDTALPPLQSLAEAQSLLDSGRAFQAHEVLEGTWKAAPSAERDLWRGLAQFAVGITHAQRGNTVGAARLLRRAADRISPWRADPPHGIDVSGLISWALSTAERIEAGESLPATPPRLTLSTREASDAPRVE